MLNEEEYQKLGEIFKKGLITKRMHEIVSEAENYSEALKAIVRLITGKIAMSRFEISSSPELTKLVSEAVINRNTLFLAQAEKMNLLELLTCWENILEAADNPKDYEVSIVLSQRTYVIIREFLDTMISPDEQFIAIRPVIKNVFIRDSNKLTKETRNYFSRIEAIVFSDPEKFIKEAQNTMIVCADVDSDEAEIIDLLCEALAKGIFLIIRGYEKLDLNALIALKEATDKSSIPDGREVICLAEESSSKLFMKPLNPILSIGEKEERRGVGMMPILARMCRT